MEVPAIIKQHPVLTVGGVIIGGLILFALIGGGGGSAASSGGSGTDPSIIAAQAQAAHDASQAGINSANLAAQIALARETGSDQIAMARIAADTTLGVTSAQLNLSKYESDQQTVVALHTLQASTDQLNISTAGQVDMSQITSNTYLGLSHDSTAAQIAAVNAQRDAAIAYANSQASAAKSKSKASIWGAVTSAALAFL